MSGWPGEKLLIKIWESLIDKGLGGLLEPWQTRRVGLAKLELQAASLLRLAQAAKDVETLSSGNNVLTGGELSLVGRSQLSVDSETIITVSNIAANTQLADSMRREINVAQAVLHAENVAIDDEEEPSPKPVDNDWLYRWRDYAGEVSSDELQTLWGKILAGEVKMPGKYSLRTLEYIRNMSKSDADAITKIAPYILDNFLVATSTTELFERPEADYVAKGIDLNFLLELDDMGILADVNSMGLSMTYLSVNQFNFLRVLVGASKLLLVKHSDASKKLQFNGYKVTRLGQELFSLCAAVSDEETLKRVGENLLKDGFDVTLASYKRLPNGGFRPVDGEVLKLQ